MARDPFANLARNAPVVMAALEKNIFEHISLMAQEQVELEYKEEMQQLAMMQQQMQANPQMAQQMQLQAQMISQKIEARKAQLIAEAMEEFLSEEKKLLGDFSNDPIAKLRARELDIRAQENARRKENDDQRLNLDKMKAMMNQQNQDEKLEQNEELAKLRADTSIEKTILGKTLPSSDQMVPNVNIIRKGN